MVSDVQTLALMGAAGLGLGAFFYGGLWWTTRRGLRSKRPGLWFAGSFVTRAGLTLAGFHFLAEGRWERLAASLAGFLAARVLAAGLTRERPKEHAHAPEPR